MQLDNILRDYTVSKNKITFHNRTYNYIEAQKKYRDNPCMKYFILDYINEPEYRQLDFSDMKVFHDFQERLIAEEFFHCIGDERYNLYIVFVVSKEDSILENINVQKDFTFARKIVLIEDEVQNFFVDCFPLKREGVENSNLEISDAKEIMRQLYQSKENAYKIFVDELKCWLNIQLLTKKNLQKKEKKFGEVQSILNILDTIIPNNNKEKEKRKSIQERSKNYEEYSVHAIYRVVINNYRKYKRKYDIPFRSVNLLYGENGTGKTSLLEAIELGMTGYNRNAMSDKRCDEKIEIRYKKNQKDIASFHFKDNYLLAKAWYGINIEEPSELNNYFKQYNYFDTSWASAFAIEGKEQVNISQLKEFLNFDDMEKCKKLLHEVYIKLGEITKSNCIQLNKINKNSIKNFKLLRYNSVKEFTKMRYIMRMKTSNTQSLIDCETELKKLAEEIEIITLENILATHINKMNKIFKLLICSDEYSELQLHKGEIVAIRSGTKEIVTMSEMSTGQKVCLALSFMFSLFMSNENSPNIIMLDEPVANLDDLHMLNLLDVLRRFAMAGTQIFFTTSNPNVAKLFRRKFSYLEEEFGFYRVSESEDTVKITYEQYRLGEENPVKTINI